MELYMVPVSYEKIEKLFGPFIATHFNEISFLLLLIFVSWRYWFRVNRRLKCKGNIQKKSAPQKRTEYKYMIDEEGHIVPDLSDQPKPVYRPQAEPEHYEPIREEYFGQYDRYSDLTDEEMRQAMQIHVVRDRPTFEEWKASKEREAEAASKKQIVKPRKVHPGK